MLGNPGRGGARLHRLLADPTSALFGYLIPVKIASLTAVIDG